MYLYQVLNSLHLDGPSFGWNSFYFHLLVPNVHITFGVCVKRCAKNQCLDRFYQIKVVTLGEPSAEAATFGISPEGFNKTLKQQKTIKIE